MAKLLDKLDAPQPVMSQVAPPPPTGGHLWQPVDQRQRAGLVEQTTETLSLRALDRAEATRQRDAWRASASDVLQDPSSSRTSLEPPDLSAHHRHARGGLMAAAVEHWIGSDAFT